MQKKEFAEILLSRYRALDYAGRHSLMICFIEATENISYGLDNEEEQDDTEFKEWSQNIMEILFPETIGE